MTLNFLTHFSQIPSYAALERLLAINQLNNAYIVVEKADQITLRKVCNNHNLTPDIICLIQSQIEPRGMLD